MAIAPESLGSLFVSLHADSTRYVAGMNAAEAATLASTGKMVSAVKVMSGAVAASFGGLAIASTKAYADFEANMQKSIAIMSNVSKDMRREMEMTARELATKSTHSAAQLAESYYFLASAGLDAKQSMAALRGVEEFAAAGAFDLAKATELLMDSQSSLGMRSKDAAENLKKMTQVSDVLTDAANASNASVEQFAEALTNKAAAAARLLGKDVEETTAVLSAFADQGVKGVEAGEKLSIVWRDLQTAAVDQKVLFKELGVSVFDANGEMRNTADIVEDLTKLLSPMSDEQKRLTLSLMGFQDRSVAAMQTLLGLSSAIKTYEQRYREAGGTTQKVSEVQMQSLNEQLKVMWHRIQEVLIQIGERLVPTLKGLMGQFDALTGDITAANSGVGKFADMMGLAIAWSVGLFQTMIQGWQGIKLIVEIVALFIMEKLSKAFIWVTEKFEGMINSFVDAENKLIDSLNRFGVKWNEFRKKQNERHGNPEGYGYMPVIQREARISLLEPDERVMGQAFAEERLKVQLELAKFAKLELPYKVLVDRVKAEQEKARAELAASQEAKAFKQEVEAGLYNSSRRPSNSSNNSLAREEFKLLNSSRRPMVSRRSSFDPEAYKLKQDMLAADPMAAAFKDLELYRRALEKNVIDTDRYKQEVERILGGVSVFFQNGPLATGMAELDAFNQLNEQERMLQESYDRQRDIILKSTELTEQQRQDLMQQMHERYMAMTEQQQRERTNLILQTSGQMFQDLATIATGFADEQSDLYQVLFAASKAFAIAESIIKIQQGIASAATLPFPANLGAMASVVAATASIVSTIQATQYTPSRAFGGGVDAGTLYRVNDNSQKAEYFRPSTRGEVIPLNKAASKGIGGSTTNNYFSFQSGVTKAEVMSMLPKVVAAAGEAERQRRRRRGDS